MKEKEIVGRFYENELQKTNQKEFKIEKVIHRKGGKLYKGYDNSFNSWRDKKDIVQMREYFPGPKFLRKVKVELDLSNYATRADLQNAREIDTSSLVK